MADPLSFEPASRHSDQALAALFNRGYAGYYAPITLDAAAFRTMVDANQIDRGASRIGARGGEPVAFAMLGVRDTRGWIGGMGVAPEARGRGYGRAMMEAVLDAARALGLKGVALGFRDRRWVDVLVRAPGPLPPGPGPTAEVVALPVQECLALHQAFHPVRPPWQRDRPALEHWADRLSAVGVRDRGGIVGWVLYRLAGDRLNLADLALAPGRSGDVLEAALRSLIGEHPETTLTLVNLPADDQVGNALRMLGATAKFRQREMTLAL